jgi:hypothetical protein
MHKSVLPPLNKQCFTGNKIIPYALSDDNLFSHKKLNLMKMMMNMSMGMKKMMNSMMAFFGVRRVAN